VIRVNRFLKLVGVGATAMMYLVVMMGALVTNTGSGMGCGQSWPLCKGTWLPDWDYHAIIEASHRGVTGLAGILVIGLAVAVWWVYRTRLITILASAAAVTLVLQAGLGAAVVLWPQPTIVLALHFGISMICFVSVLLLTVLLFGANQEREGTEEPVSRQFVNWAWFVALFGYVVVYLGAFVRHMKASQACLGWPLCNGDLIPPLTGLVGIAFIHRLAAALLTVLVIRLAVLARKTGRVDLRRGADLTLLLLLAQVVSGAFFGFGNVDLMKQMSHGAIVTAFGGALGYVCLMTLPLSARTLKLRT
jgi:cytochrome c oxidase assembly protein subunit 15